MTKRRTLTAGVAFAALALASGAWAQTEAVTAAPDGLGEVAPAEVAAETPLPPPPPPATGTISEAIAAGHILLDVRARYELVDQKKTAVLRNNAEAYTLRTRIGWETADWNDFRGLVEFEDVRILGERYAVNVPGATTPPLNGASKAIFPLVNDPAVTELNRAQVTWTPSAALSVVAGRQRILIDDQRFVGSVGWRQDEQTFDGVKADFAIGRFKATYAYLTKINRILGEARDWDSDSHLLNATWSPAEALRLQGFVYALDFSNSAANSSITSGLKASGKTWVGLYQVAYAATYAKQSEYRTNTAPFDLAYWGGDVTGTFDVYSLKLSYESLEGNGARAFTTPLATTHLFNGWSDALVLPLGGNKSFVDGLEDLNLTFNVKPRFKFTYLFNTDWTVRYHDFDNQRTGAKLGREWDAQVTAAINAKFSIALKYADFEREATVPVGSAAPPPSRTKVWFTIQYTL